VVSTIDTVAKKGQYGQAEQMHRCRSVLSNIFTINFTVSVLMFWLIFVTFFLTGVVGMVKVKIGKWELQQIINRLQGAAVLCACI